MILEISEALKLLNANNITIKGMSLDANGVLDIGMTDTNLARVRIGADPATGNGGIQLTAGRIDLYGAVYVNGVAI